MPHEFNNRAVGKVLVGSDVDAPVQLVFGVVCQRGQELIRRRLIGSDEVFSASVNADGERRLLFVKLFGLRLGQVNRYSGNHERRRDHEDDKQHKHHVDQRRHIDFAHRRVAGIVVVTPQ